MHALVINHGREGAEIYIADAVRQIPGIDRQDISDLTGADDAFCAGITQKHTFTMDSFKQLFKRIFGYALLT